MYFNYHKKQNDHFINIAAYNITAIHITTSMALFCNTCILFKNVNYFYCVKMYMHVYYDNIIALYIIYRMFYNSCQLNKAVLYALFL